MVLNFKQLLSVSFGISKSIIYASQGSMPLQDWNWKFKGLKQLQPATEKQFTRSNPTEVLFITSIWYLPLMKRKLSAGDCCCGPSIVKSSLK